MISEIGAPVTVKIPRMTVDAFGNHVSTKWTDYAEVLWITENNEVMEIQGVGQLNREDIRFVAPYNTAIVIESKILYNGRTYTVLSIDRPDESGNVVTLVGYAKRELN